MRTVDTVGELYRLLPEVGSIYDTELREQVEQIFIHHVPDYFWNKPSSSTGKYHATEDNTNLGIVNHTRKAFSIFMRLKDSLGHKHSRRQNSLSKQQIEYAKAAILLHDTYKYGETGNQYKSDHGIRAKYHLHEDTELPNLPNYVLNAIHAHSGPWGTRQPKNKLERIVHICDMVASHSNLHINGIGENAWRDQ